MVWVLEGPSAWSGPDSESVAEVPIWPQARLALRGGRRMQQWVWGPAGHAGRLVSLRVWPVGCAEVAWGTCRQSEVRVGAVRCRPDDRVRRGRLPQWCRVSGASVAGPVPAVPGPLGMPGLAGSSRVGGLKLGLELGMEVPAHGPQVPKPPRRSDGAANRTCDLFRMSLMSGSVKLPRGIEPLWDPQTESSGVVGKDPPHLR